MSDAGPSRRHGFYLADPPPHSSKIYEVLGFPPGHTPPLSSIFPRQQQEQEQEQEQNGNALATKSPGANNPLPSLPAPPTESQSKATRPGAFLSLVQASGPIWFTWSLDPLLLSLLLALLPPAYRFPGLPTVSTAPLLLSLVLFTLTTCILLVRLGVYHTIFPCDIDDAPTFGFLFLPLWPTTFLLLLALASLDIASAPSGLQTRSFTLAVYVGWWIGAASAVGTLFTVLWWLLSWPRPGRRTPAGRLVRPMAVLVATSAVVVAAFVGGLIVERLDVDEGMGRPVVVFSLATTGAGLVVALAADTVLLHELVLVTGWPPGDQAVMMFFPVGPLAGGAAAFKVLGDGVRGLREEVRAAVGVVLGVGAVLMMGVAVVVLGVALLAVTYSIGRREVRWNQTWCGVVFPVAMVGLLGDVLGVSLNSKFFAIVACVLLVVCTILYFVNFVMATRSGVMGWLLRSTDKSRSNMTSGT